jgi:predicted ATPase
LVNWRRNPAPALLDALLHQLEVLAQKGPVLMVFEDAHWVDPSSRELLDLMNQENFRKGQIRTIDIQRSRA